MSGFTIKVHGLLIDSHNAVRKSFLTGFLNEDSKIRTYRLKNSGKGTKPLESRSKNRQRSLISKQYPKDVKARSKKQAGLEGLQEAHGKAR